MKSFSDFGIDVPTHAAGQTATTCPQCSSQRRKKSVKCLSVNADEGVWNCHHCGWSGSLKQGVYRSDDLHWRKPVYKKPFPLPAVSLAEKVVAWFAKRGIIRDVLSRNKITSSQVYMPQVEDFVNAIAFPYFRQGELINVKYRDAEKNFRLEVGAERLFYGLDDIDEDQTIIVEGELDKLSLEVAGFKNCISVPDGAPCVKSSNYSSKFEFLKNDEDVIQSVKTWVIAVDSDEAGQRLDFELSRRLGRENCKRVSWPKDCKDANEVLVKLGSDALADCIKAAEFYPIKGAFEVNDLSSKVYNLFEKGWEKGVSTGWWSLDGLYTVRPGEFTVVTGIPGSGKSNWVDCLSINLAKNHGWAFAVFSPENQPLEDHAARLIEKYAHVPFFDGPTRRMSEQDLTSSMQWMNDKIFWLLHEDDTEWTIDNILESAKELVYRKGVNGLIIDPWNEVEHPNYNGMSETQYISSVLKHVRQFARHHAVHVWVIAHPQKLYKDKDGNYPVPTPYDISGSAHWRNKADNCITIWRNYDQAKKHEVDVHVQKIRFRQIGQVGIAELIYEPPTATYRDKQEYEYATVK